MLNFADFSYHCLFNPLRNIETIIYVLNLNKDYWSASFPSRCVSPHKFQCVSSGKYVLSGEDPCSFSAFFVPRTWFHDRKTDGTWPMPKKLIKGSKCLRSTSRWDHLASWRSRLFAGERNALDAAEVIWKTENDEAKTAKRVERILARICPRVVNWTLLVGQPSQIYLNV